MLGRRIPTIFHANRRQKRRNATTTLQVPRPAARAILRVSVPPATVRNSVYTNRRGQRVLVDEAFFPFLTLAVRRSRPELVTDHEASENPDAAC